MKDVKIVIGANYGDEGKGLVTRNMVLDAKSKGLNPIVVFSQGTAQRGHTVDYSEDNRRVFKHFGSGTLDGSPTFFARNFLIHPMQYVREFTQITKSGNKPPVTYCDKNCKVITPWDMLVDHMTEAHIARLKGEREYGSCGFGSWCATDRFNKGTCYTVEDFRNPLTVRIYLNSIWNTCLEILTERGIDIDKLPEYSKYFEPNSTVKETTIRHFEDDLAIFYNTTDIVNWNTIWNNHDSIIFENGQGLGLSKDYDTEWGTTSYTGIFEPKALLGDNKVFNAEVLYVTRSYSTRHGIGKMEEELNKDEINPNMVDRTNVHNEFQGTLRYGFIDKKSMCDRIDKDFGRLGKDVRFTKSLVVTHCNEFTEFTADTKYYSDNPYSISIRR